MGSNVFFSKHSRDALLNEDKINKKDPTKLGVKGTAIKLKKLQNIELFC